MARITVFDSGVGGLSIYAEIAPLCAQHDLVFVSDNAAYPYGTKSESELIQRVTRVVEITQEHYQSDIFVVACNSASTVALDALRRSFDCEFVGVVPAIKPAASASKTGVLGLLATPGTVSRSYTQQLIEDFASHCKVVSIGSSELVDLVELKMQGQSISLKEVTRIVQPMLEEPTLDTIVLACTHFPLLGREFAQVFECTKRTDIKLVDSGAAVASRVVDLLKQFDQQLVDRSKPLREACFTDYSDRQQSQVFLSYLEKLGFEKVSVLSID